MENLSKSNGGNNANTMLCTVVKRCKNCKHYKQHRCMQMIDDVPEMAVIRFPNAITKCTMFEKFNGA